MERKREMCRHCGVKVVSRPRGLCWGCFHKPAVLALYPRGSGGGRCPQRGLRGTKAGDNPNRPAARRTAHLPRSGDKLLVLIARAAAGEAMFHPADAAHAD